MHTLFVTFYAYKGGTGRTLALSNVARFLADELGYRVGLVDFDLESPGLIHEALCTTLEESAKSREVTLKAMNERQGFIECFFHGARSSRLNIDDYVYPLSSGRNGGILLMPAARGSVSKEPSYTEQVSKFLNSLTSPAGIDLASQTIWRVLKTFADSYQLNYLFIDGRTGANSFLPIYTYSVPHLLVLFSGLNDQNILGGVSTLQVPDESAPDSVPVILVLSPVPTVGPAEYEERLAFVTNHLAIERAKRKPGVRYRYDLPSGIDFFLPYSDAAAFGEVYFPGRYPNSLLASAHRGLANRIANLVIEPRPEKPSEVHSATSPIIRTKPVTLAVEDVHVDILSSDSVVLYKYGAEEETAPWEVLDKIPDHRAKDFLSKQADIIVVPQTHVQALTAKCQRELFYDLNRLRSRPEGRDQRVLNYEFLDEYYRNWRRWCSTEHSFAGLPFSVNAMLLCANARLLEPICAVYWRLKRQRPTNNFFLPSSWENLTALINAGRQTDIEAENIFRVVRGKRGLYFDWLNFAASLGGFDLIQTEGRFNEDVIIGRAPTIDATRQFIELARLSGKSDTMGQQIKLFRDHRLAMYVGWTDSFRFDRSAGVVSGVSVTPLEEEITAEPKKDIRLGHSPRDMRHPRKSLVDGWVILFPQKTDDPDHLPRALRFANDFLDPDHQRALLQRGFPSPSIWAIEKELNTLHADRTAASGSFQSENALGRARARKRRDPSEQSYQVFLETMKSAIYSGRWVASPSSKIDEVISSKLEYLISDRNANVKAEMESLDDTVRSLIGLQRRM